MKRASTAFPSRLMLTGSNKRILAAALISLLIHLAVMEIAPRWRATPAKLPGRKTVRLSLVTRSQPPKEKTPEKTVHKPPTVRPPVVQPIVQAPPRPKPLPPPKPVEKRAPPAVKQTPPKKKAVEQPKPVETPKEPVLLESAAPQQMPISPPLQELAVPLKEEALSPPESLTELQAVVVEAAPLYHKNPPPNYPSRARRRHLQGTVLLDVLVSEVGRVETVALHESSGHSLLDKAAQQAVVDWQFEPGSRNGIPVSMRVLVPVRFQLK